MQAGALEQLGRPIEIGQERGGEVLIVEIADWQPTLGSITEDVPLQWLIWLLGSRRRLFGEDGERARHQIAGLGRTFARYWRRGMRCGSMQGRGGLVENSPQVRKRERAQGRSSLVWRGLIQANYLRIAGRDTNTNQIPQRRACDTLRVLIMHV